jgi:hypothetical protein
LLIALAAPFAVHSYKQQRLVTAIAGVLRLTGAGAVQTLGVENAKYGQRRLSEVPRGPPLAAFVADAPPPVDAFAGPPQNAFPAEATASALKQKTSAFKRFVDSSLESPFEPPIGAFPAGQDEGTADRGHEAWQLGDAPAGDGGGMPKAVMVKLRIALRDEAEAHHVASRIRSSTFALALAKQLASSVAPGRTATRVGVGVRVAFDPIVSFSAPVVTRTVRHDAAVRVARATATAKVRLAAESKAADAALADAAKEHAIVLAVLFGILVFVVCVVLRIREHRDRHRSAQDNVGAEVLPLHEVTPGYSVTTADMAAL